MVAHALGPTAARTRAVGLVLALGRGRTRVPIRTDDGTTTPALARTPTRTRIPVPTLLGATPAVRGRGLTTRTSVLIRGPIHGAVEAAVVLIAIIVLGALGIYRGTPIIRGRARTLSVLHGPARPACTLPLLLLPRQPVRLRRVRLLFQVPLLL